MCSKSAPQRLRSLARHSSSNSLSPVFQSLPNSKPRRCVRANCQQNSRSKQRVRTALQNIKRREHSNRQQNSRQQQNQPDNLPNRIGMQSSRSRQIQSNCLHHTKHHPENWFPRPHSEIYFFRRRAFTDVCSLSRCPRSFTRCRNRTGAPVKSKCSRNRFSRKRS